MKRFLAAGLCLLVGSSRAWAAGDDFAIWTFLGLNKKISKTVSFYSEAEYRTREKAGRTDCWSLYGEFSFRICPYVQAGAGYTYIDYNHPSTGPEARHRLNAFVTGSYTAGAWSFALRGRYEQLHRRAGHADPQVRRTLRSRFECKYKVPGSCFTPYATVELYTGLNTLRGVRNDKIRYTAGTSVAFCRRHSFSVYYRYIDMLQRSPGNSHILGCGFRFNL